MNAERLKSDMELDPQITKSWHEFHLRLEKVKEVRQIGKLLDSIQSESMASGNKIINASLAIMEVFPNMLQAAENLEEQTTKDLAKMLVDKYGQGISFRINEDGSLELNNGIIYPND